MPNGLRRVESGSRHAERKRYYSRVGMDGVWMVRMQCPGKRRWARAKCVIVGSEAGEESGVQKTGTLHTAPNKTEGGTTISDTRRAINQGNMGKSED